MVAENRLTSCSHSAADKNASQLNRLLERGKNLEKKMAKKISQSSTKIHAVEKQPLTVKQKELNRETVGLMEFFKFRNEENILPSLLLSSFPEHINLWLAMPSRSILFIFNL